MADKLRKPHCSKCRNHGVLSPLKGHKRRCTVQKCTCAKCELVDIRRDISKRQIALRRLQTEDEQYGAPETTIINSEDHSNGTSKPVYRPADVACVRSATSAPPVNPYNYNYQGAPAPYYNYRPWYEAPVQTAYCQPNFTNNNANHQYMNNTPHPNFINRNGMVEIKPQVNWSN
ncbi:hypothetical protein SNE40_012524 [Patella caerulea]|uniref:DM domain-containing protein n=1 Tax=Patella caerulea TaxID=87958 RepID=A0AAN8JUM3_PATCE